MANPNPGDAVVVIAPVDLAVAQTGGWISLKGAAGVTLNFNKGAGTAGQPPVLTFRQATSTAGANAKNLATVTTIYKKAAGATGWTKVTQAAGATYTGDVAAGLYKVDINGAALDTANGFCAVSVNIASSGAAAQLGGIVGELYGLRYSGALEDALAPFSAVQAEETAEEAARPEGETHEDDVPHADDVRRAEAGTQSAARAGQEVSGSHLAGERPHTSQSHGDEPAKRTGTPSKR